MILSDYLSPEAMEALKARDGRFRVLDEALAVAAELRDSVALKTLIRGIEGEAQDCMDELAEVSPTDVNAVSKLLVKVRTAVYMRRSLNAILMRGKVAEADISQFDRGDEGE